MNPLGVAEPAVQPGKIIRFACSYALRSAQLFFSALFSASHAERKLLLMGIVLLIKLLQHLARLHHGSAVQAILAAELFLLFVLGGEIGTMRLYPH